MGFLANTRFNPKTGILDFWHEFRKPTPYRWPILIVSTLPFCLIFFWLSGENFYGAPERPTVTYITTYEPGRTDDQIAASNRANQEVKDLREAYEEELAQSKRDLYKALGAASGMDVEEIDRQGEETRAAEAAAKRAQLDAMMGRTDPDGDSQADAPPANAPAQNTQTGNEGNLTQQETNP